MYRVEAVSQLVGRDQPSHDQRGRALREAHRLSAVADGAKIGNANDVCIHGASGRQVGESRLLVRWQPGTVAAHLGEQRGGGCGRRKRIIRIRQDRDRSEHDLDPYL